MTNVQLSQDELNKFKQLVLDPETVSFPERYALLYHELLNSSNCRILVPFSIAEFKKALSVILSRQECKLIEKTFGLCGGIIHYLRKQDVKNIALINMMKSADEIMSKLRSMQSMYLYAPKVREYIDLAAKKVWDPHMEYDNVTKAKYICLYYVFLLNYHRFPLDTDDLEFTPEYLSYEEYQYILPYIIHEAYEKFFKKQPDGDLCIPMIDTFFEDQEASLKNDIYAYMQITSDKYSYKSLAYVRNLKEQLFPKGSWRSGTDLFRMSSIKSMSVRHFNRAALAYRNYLRGSKVSHSTEKVQFCRKTVYVDVEEYCRGFFTSDVHELFAYKHLQEFLTKQCPSLPMGKKEIPFSCSSAFLEKFYIS